MKKHFELIPFKKASNISNINITAQVTVLKNLLQVEFLLSGDLNQLIIPEKKINPIRIYDLWEHTCFEFFIKRKDQSSYIEFNFTPSGDWNCFFISSYRVNEGEYAPVKNQIIETKFDSDKLILKSDISLSLLSDLSVEDFQTKNIELNLTCVVEDKNQLLHYFALVHKNSKPDFHDGFVDF